MDATLADADRGARPARSVTARGPAGPRVSRRPVRCDRPAVGRSAPRCWPRPVAAARAAGFVVRRVLLALLGGHLVEQHVGAVERDALQWSSVHIFFGSQVEVRLRDERLAVVADVAAFLDDVGEYPSRGKASPIRACRRAGPSRASRGRCRSGRNAISSVQWQVPSSTCATGRRPRRRPCPRGSGTAPCRSSSDAGTRSRRPLEHDRPCGRSAWTARL